MLDNNSYNEKTVVIVNDKKKLAKKSLRNISKNIRKAKEEG